MTDTMSIVKPYSREWLLSDDEVNTRYTGFSR